MEFKQVVQNRRSDRSFIKDRAIAIADLQDIVEEAGRTPSWANSQPWKVYIATGQTLAQIKEDHLQRAMRSEPGRADFETMHRMDWSLQAQQNMGRWNVTISRYLGREHGQDFPRLQAHLFNASAIAYLAIPEPAPAWAIMDMGAFAQTLMLSATAHGVGSIPAYELVKYPKPVRKVMGIPDSELLALGIAMGYADEAYINGFRSQRMSLDEYQVIK